MACGRHPEWPALPSRHPGALFCFSPRTKDGKHFTESRLLTGVSGLDEILYGGLQRNNVFLVEGDPGTGKTTLALQFLMSGTAQGERGLLLTLSESRRELSSIARSHGWSLDSIDIVESHSG